MRRVDGGLVGVKKAWNTNWCILFTLHLDQVKTFPLCCSWHIMAPSGLVRSMTLIIRWNLEQDTYKKSYYSQRLQQEILLCLFWINVFPFFHVCWRCGSESEECWSSSVTFSGHQNHWRAAVSFNMRLATAELLIEWVKHTFYRLCLTQDLFHLTR